MNTNTLHVNSSSALHLERSASRRRAPAVEIVIPVYNEERTLAASVRQLHRYMSASSPSRFGSRSPTTRA